MAIFIAIIIATLYTTYILMYIIPVFSRMQALVESGHISGDSYGDRLDW